MNVDMYLLSFMGISNSTQYWYLSNNKMPLLKLKIMM
jgi:hypothetical protein